VKIIGHLRQLGRRPVVRGEIQCVSPARITRLSVGGHELAFLGERELRHRRAAAPRLQVAAQRFASRRVPDADAVAARVASQRPSG